MDLSVKPGQDFYLYANGNWIKNHPIPADENACNSFQEVSDRSREILRSLFEEAGKKTDAPKGSAEQLVGDFYASYMNEAQIEKDGAKPLDAEMKHIEAIANVNDLLDGIAHLQSINVGVPFEIYADQDQKESTNIILHLEQSGLSMPDRDYYTQTDETSKTLREKYVAHVAKMLQLLGDDAASATKQAATVLAIETELANASFTRVQRRDAEKNYHKMTPAELAALTPNLAWAAHLFRAAAHRQTGG